MKTVEEKAHAAWVRGLKKYGITEEEYAALYKRQGGRCAICRIATGKTRRLAVDHDHACLREHHAGAIAGICCVRGLVCSGSLSANTCNRLIGHYSQATLERAATYLALPQAGTFLAQMRRGDVPCPECGWMAGHAPLCTSERCGADWLADDLWICHRSPGHDGMHRTVDGGEWLTFDAPADKGAEVQP